MEKSSLTVPILDALSNLNLNPELMTEVKLLSTKVQLYCLKVVNDGFKRRSCTWYNEYFFENLQTFIEHCYCLLVSTHVLNCSVNQILVMYLY